MCKRDYCIYKQRTISHSCGFKQLLMNLNFSGNSPCDLFQVSNSSPTIYQGILSRSTAALETPSGVAVLVQVNDQQYQAPWDLWAV